MCHCVHGEVEGQFVGVGPLHHVSSWNQTQVCEFGSRRLSTLSHLTGT